MAMLSGFLDWADANEWVVTRKLGRVISKKTQELATKLDRAKKAMELPKTSDCEKKKKDLRERVRDGSFLRRVRFVRRPGARDVAIRRVPHFAGSCVFGVRAELRGREVGCEA